MRHAALRGREKVILGVTSTVKNGERLSDEYDDDDDEEVGAGEGGGGEVGTDFSSV